MQKRLKAALIKWLQRENCWWWKSATWLPREIISRAKLTKWTRQYKVRRRNWPKILHVKVSSQCWYTFVLLLDYCWINISHVQVRSVAMAGRSSRTAATTLLIAKKAGRKSREYCQNKGADLAIITSQKEMVRISVSINDQPIKLHLYSPYSQICLPHRI